MIPTMKANSSRRPPPKPSPIFEPIPHWARNFWILVLALWTVLMTLISAGWMTLPAKQTDLDRVAAKVEALAPALERLSDTVAKNGQALVELTATLKEMQRAQSTPVAPPAPPPAKRKSKPKSGWEF